MNPKVLSRKAMNNWPFWKAHGGCGSKNRPSEGQDGTRGPASPDGNSGGLDGDGMEVRRRGQTPDRF